MPPPLPVSGPVHLTRRPFRLEREEALHRRVVSDVTLLNYVIPAVVQIPNATVFTLKELLAPQPKGMHEAPGYTKYKQHFTRLRPDHQRWLKERMHSPELAMPRNGVLQLNPKGQQLRGCCPIHKSSDPRSFIITPDKGLWVCWWARPHRRAQFFLNHFSDLRTRRHKKPGTMEGLRIRNTREAPPARLARWFGEKPRADGADSQTRLLALAFQFTTL